MKPSLNFLSASQLAAMLRAGDITSRQAVEAYVRRRMIWNRRRDFGAESLGSSVSGYAA